MTLSPVHTLMLLRYLYFYMLIVNATKSLLEYLEFYMVIVYAQRSSLILIQINKVNWIYRSLSQATISSLTCHSVHRLLPSRLMS